MHLLERLPAALGQHEINIGCAASGEKAIEDVYAKAHASFHAQEGGSDDHSHSAITKR